MADAKFLPGIPTTGSPKLESLLKWEDPKMSGAVLGGALVSYYFLELSSMSMFSLACNLSLLLVFASFVWANLSKYLPKDYKEVPLPAFIKTDISSDQIASFTESALPIVNQVRGKVVQVATGSDPILSVKVMGSLYTARKVVGMFGSIANIGLIVVVLAFILPKVYEMQRAEVDKALAMLAEKAGELYKKVDESVLKKIPRSSSAKKSE